MIDVESLAISNRTLMESAADALLVVDGAGAILYANRRAATLFGHEAEALCAMSVEDLLPEPLRDRHVRLRRRYGRRPRVRAMAVAVDLVARHRDGSELPVTVSLSPVEEGDRPLVLASVRDARPRRALEDALLTEHERSAAILQSMGDGLIATDEDGAITHINAQAARLVGADAQASVGRRLEDVLLLFDLQTQERASIPVDCRQRGAVLVASLSRAKVVRSDGSTSIVSASCAPIVGASQRGHGTVVILRDVTEQCALERRADAAEQLAALGILATGIAHELNSPLTYVLGNLELAERYASRLLTDFEGVRPIEHHETILRLGRRIRHCLSEAEEGAHRMRIIAGDLRTLGRPEASPSTPTNVQEVIEAALRITMGELEQRARVSTALAPVPPALATPTRLGQVLINLLINAGQAFPDPRRPDAMIHVRCRPHSALMSCIEVEDNGTGIPQSDLPHVFERFYTTKPASEGTGLGLAICDGIVRDFGGHIELSSEAGVGTKVSVFVPNATEHLAREPPDHEDRPAARSRR